MKTEYTIQNNKVSVYCDKKIYRDFEPYFYVKADSFIPRLPEIVKVLDTSRLNLYGNKLKRIVTRVPPDVKRIRDRFDWTGEADIRFTKRFNIDKKIKQSNKVKLFMDIEEVVPKDGNPDNTGAYPISMIGLYNEYNDMYHQWVQHPELFIKSIDIKWENRLTKKLSKRVIHQFNNEKLMLLDFISYMIYHKPDMLIEWSNKHSFDVINIIERMKKDKINYRLLSPIRRVGTDRYVDISTIETTNMLQYYKRHHIGELHSYALDIVCKKEFGIGKLYNIDDYEKEWNENLVKLLDYNLCDVELMVNLNDYTKLFDNIQYIIDGIGCEFEDYMSSTSIVRHYLLKKAIDYNVVLDTWKYETIVSFTGYNEALFKSPVFTLIEYRKELNRGLVRINKRFKKKEDERRFIRDTNKEFSNISIFTIKGAYVVEPKSGLYDDIELYDYRGMYPNVMIEKNMSPETLVKYEDRHKYKPEDLHNIGNGVYFLKKHIKEGFIPKVLVGLFDLRYDVKNQMIGLDKNSRKYKILDGQQTGIKYLINSFWGVMKFICVWIAESITFTGQKILKWTINKSKELGCEVVYGDTDSIYIVKKNYTSKKKLEILLMEEFKKELGMSIELEHEGYFPKALFLTKKRYVLLREEYTNIDDKYKYKGIEIVRSNESEFNKELQKKFIDMLFEGKDENDVVKYLQAEIKDMPNKPPTFVGRPARLNFKRKTKTGITKYEMAARVANRILYKRYDTGDKPYYLPRICFDYDNEVTITDDMIPELKDETYQKLGRLFDALGWDIGELMSEYKIPKYDI